MEVPPELASSFKFVKQKSKLAGTIRGSFFVIKGEYGKDVGMSGVARGEAVTRSSPVPIQPRDWSKSSALSRFLGRAR
jgi:hypothetical protein